MTTTIYGPEEWDFCKEHKDLIMIRPCTIKCDNENNDDEVAGLLYVKDGNVVFQPACTEEKIILEVTDILHRMAMDDGLPYDTEIFCMRSKEYKVPFTNITYSFGLYLEYEMDDTYLPVALTVTTM